MSSECHSKIIYIEVVTHPLTLGSDPGLLWLNGSDSASLQVGPSLIKVLKSLGSKTRLRLGMMKMTDSEIMGSRYNKSNQIMRYTCNYQYLP